MYSHAAAQAAGGKPQGGLSWVYNDLPVTKFKVLGIIQIVIGSIYLFVHGINSYNGDAGYYNVYLAITVRITTNTNHKVSKYNMLHYSIASNSINVHTCIIC